MSLDADWSRVEGYDTLTDAEVVTRNALTFATMATGIGGITETNAREFFARVSFWEKVNGAYRYDENGPVFFKPEDITRFIGLRTNASTLTTAQFYKNVWKAHERFNVPSSL